MGAPGDDVADLPGTRAEALPPARRAPPEGCGPAQAHEREAASPGPTAADARTSGTVPLCFCKMPAEAGIRSGHCGVWICPDDRCEFWAWRDEPEAPQDLPAPSAVGAGSLTDADAERLAPRLLNPTLHITDETGYYAWPLPRLPPPNFHAPALPLQPVPAEDGEQPGDDEAD